MTSETNIEIEEQSSKKPDYLWLIGCAVVTAIATIWRFYELTLKPLHHDEGVNGYFLKHFSAKVNINMTPAIITVQLFITFR